MAIHSDGQLGEQLAIAFFKFKKRKCLQSDLIVENKDGNYFIVEVKHQEKFKPPPFYGHGLPPYQVEARLKFYKKTNMRCMFWVFDKEEHVIYWQWLDELDTLDNDKFVYEATNIKFITKNKTRVVYKLENFNKIMDWNGWRSFFNVVDIQTV